jgi:hypothetical protein
VWCVTRIRNYSHNKPTSHELPDICPVKEDVRQPPSPSSSAKRQALLSTQPSKAGRTSACSGNGAIVAGRGSGLTTVRTLVRSFTRFFRYLGPCSHVWQSRGLSPADVGLVLSMSDIHLRHGSSSDIFTPLAHDLHSGVGGCREMVSCKRDRLNGVFSLWVQGLYVLGRIKVRPPAG